MKEFKYRTVTSSMDCFFGMEYQDEMHLRHFEGKSSMTFEEWMQYFIYSKEYLQIIVLKRICNKEGHNWADEGYGGSESGCIDLHCIRCGHSIYNQLY